MSGQFEQRRLARPAYQREASSIRSPGIEGSVRPSGAWRDLQAARRRVRRADPGRRRRGGAARRAARARRRTRPASSRREDELRAERERLRHVTELAEGPRRPQRALTPEDGEGATDWSVAAERAVAPLERLAPELAGPASAATGRAPTARDRIRAARLPRLARGRPRAGSNGSKGSSIGLADLGARAIGRRRSRELLERAVARREELAAVAGGHDPAQAAEAPRGRRSGCRRHPCRAAGRPARRRRAVCRRSRHGTPESASEKGSLASSSRNARAWRCRAGPMRSGS